MKIEDSICFLLKKKYKLHIEDACFAKGVIPNKIILDRTRNIHSYLVCCDVKNNIPFSDYWKNENIVMTIKSILSVQYSDLDRPLFFILKYEDGSMKAIEGNYVREAILDDSNMDIVKYILDNSDDLLGVLIKVNAEL